MVAHQVAAAGVTPKPTGKLADVFPDGIPTSAAEMQKYLVSISVPITTKSGNKTTANIQVHKAVKDDVIYALQQAQNAGFIVYSVGGYSWRNMVEGSSRSMHSYGLAVDINPNENPYISGSKIVGSGKYQPGKNPYSIPADGVLVKAFKAKGWGWGGDWKSKKDYMHFSYTGN